MMVSYTATSMALAIAAGQSVVAVANLLMTITFVFMIVSSIIQFSRVNPEILAMLKSRNPTSTEFSWILQKNCRVEHVDYPDFSDLNILILWGQVFWFVLYTNKNRGTRRAGCEGEGEWFLCGSGSQRTAWKAEKRPRATFPSIFFSFAYDKFGWLRTWPTDSCSLRPLP